LHFTINKYAEGFFLGKNLVTKILEKHLVSGELESGKEISVSADQVLTQDATGTMAFLQFEAIGAKKIVPHAVSFVDHNTIQSGFENPDDHAYLKNVAMKYGAKYSKAGNGICHQVHLERFGVPGTILLGSDSHTTTGGGIGQFAVGVGGLDVALAMAGEPFYFSCPQIVKVNLKGKLNEWCTAKDVVLKVLELFSVKGNVGKVFEYSGEGVKTLSVPERATITNMGAECGVTTSVFPSDEITKQFLKAQGREKEWVELSADEDAEYDEEVEINLSEIVPLIAFPHSPGNIKPVKEFSGTKLNQVCVGSCTNSSFKDLMVVASILKGKKVHPNVSLVVAPGSKQVLEMISSNGALSDLISAGARIAENACGFCIGNSQAPETNGVSLRTSNRNFLGRSGTKSAQIYLSSPETAAVSALKGEITDPQTAGIPYPDINVPEVFPIDDSMVLLPSEKPETVEIIRGPNIGEPPYPKPLPEKISGVIAIKAGDNTTTDHIIPAGSKMMYRSNVPKYSEFVFEVLDPQFSKKALQNKEKGIDNIVIAGLSYGQGSSREHAAICPMYLGVKAVIAQSIERIHSANLINFGILPLIISKEDYEKCSQGDEIIIGDLYNQINTDEISVENRTKSFIFKVKNNLTDRQKKIVLAGGMLNCVGKK
jgi:aconitate hydratase